MKQDLEFCFKTLFQENVLFFLHSMVKENRKKKEGRRKIDRKKRSREKRLKNIQNDESEKRNRHLTR